MNYLQKATEQLFIYTTPKKIVEYIKREKILKLIQNPKFKTDETSTYFWFAFEFFMSIDIFLCKFP